MSDTHPAHEAGRRSREAVVARDKEAWLAVFALAAEKPAPAAIGASRCEQATKITRAAANAVWIAQAFMSGLARGPVDTFDRVKAGLVSHPAHARRVGPSPFAGAFVVPPASPLDATVFPVSGVAP